MAAPSVSDLETTLTAVCVQLRSELAVWAEPTSADQLAVRACGGAAARRVPDPIFAPVGSLIAVAATGDVAQLLPSLLLLARPGTRTRALRVGPAIVASARSRTETAVVVLARRLAAPPFTEGDASFLDDLVRRLLGVAPGRQHFPRPRRPLHRRKAAAPLDLRQPLEVTWP
jgi:hypothetical protein